MHVRHVASVEEAEGDVAQGKRRGSLHALAIIPPQAVTALVLRMRALVSDWVKEEVKEDSIAGAEGIVGHEVIKTFYEAGGDLGDAVPFALLEARKSFMSEVDEGRSHALNSLRALACEVVARRLVAFLEAPEKEENSEHHEEQERRLRDGHHVALCKRFQRLDAHGDVTHPTSALESAVDQNCVRFLASREAQICAEELWQGKLVQHFAPSGEVFFTPHDPSNPSFIGRLDPARLNVPRYSYYAGLAIHVALIVVYTFCTLEYTGLDAWEVALWIIAAGYLLDDIARWVKMGGLDKIISFWIIVDLCTDVLFVTSFSFRVMGWLGHAPRSAEYRLLAFQFLSCIAPLLWMQLLKLADGFQYFGVIQIVLLRMLQETAAFFLLLLITAIGFAQSLFALDAADGHRVENSGSFVANLLAATIMGNPDFDAPGDNFGQPFGTILVYVYAFITLMLLANILVAFFASAYDKTVDDADDVFRAYFCSKVVSALRAPDQFVYLPPFNLIEAFFIAPFELFISKKAYAAINRAIQSALFFIPLTVIALYESRQQITFTKRIYLEMLDDLPEERLRNVALAAGIDDVRNPKLKAAAISQGKQHLAASSSLSKAYLSREEFDAGAKKYAELSHRHPTGHEEIDLGAHLYAQGWSWDDGVNAPHTGHISRTFSVAMPLSPSEQHGNDDALESMGLEVGSPSSASQQEGPQAVRMQAISITQTISFSSTWKVPVIYIEAANENGEPIAVDELCASTLFSDKMTQTSSDLLESDQAAFPAVSMGENPANGNTAVYLHPCETASSVALVLKSSGDKLINRQDLSLAYMEAFIMLCSTAVEMRPGSKLSARQADEEGPTIAEAGGVEGHSPLPAGSGDFVIAREYFDALLGKLPNVESKKRLNSDAKIKSDAPSSTPAASAEDVAVLLNEIRQLRREVANLRKP